MRYDGFAPPPAQDRFACAARRFCRAAGGARRRAGRPRARGWADQGRRHRFHQRRLCAAGVQVQRAGDRANPAQLAGTGDPLRAPGRCRGGRSARGRRTRLHQRRAPRSRRRRDPHCAGAQAEDQHHAGRRAVLSRYAAGKLDRRHARTAERGGRAIGAARARGREAVAETARRGSAPHAAAGPRQGRQRAHLHPLRVRSAGRRRRVAGARQGDVHARFRPRHQMGSGRRAGGDSADAANGEDRDPDRCQHGELRAQGRTGCAHVPRGQPFRRRHRA